MFALAPAINLKRSVDVEMIYKQEVIFVIFVAEKGTKMNDLLNKDCKIPLSQGKFALVNEDDYGILKRFKWTLSILNGRPYATRMMPTSEAGKLVKKTILMHREIMKPPQGMEVDHRDGNGLNNQRSNLRICTHAENVRNRGKQKNNKSGYKGVKFEKRGNKYVAQIKYSNVVYYLGTFSSPVEAHEAYKEASKKLHKKYGRYE